MSDGLSDSLNRSHIIDSCGCSRVDGKIVVICRVHSAVPIIESSSTEAPSPYTIKTSGTGEPFVPAPKELHKAVKNALFGHRVPSKEEFEKSTKDHEEHMKAAKEYYAEAGSIFEYVDRRLPDVNITIEEQQAIQGVKLGVPSEGVKHDANKVRMELLPVTPLVDIAKVLTFGAKKYSDENWRKGISYKRVYGALLRHLTSWYSGEENDAETGESHLAHAGCCLLFLLEYAHTKTEFDDRYKGDK